MHLGAFMTHHYIVGDNVRLAYGFFDRDAVGTYRVTRLMPAAGDGELQYRIIGEDGRERVISERQIARDGFAGHGRPRSGYNPITEAFNRLKRAAPALKPEPLS
jgi:hypothetical protein